MRVIFAVLVVCFVGLGGGHAQTMYRCVDSAGKVTFTDGECVGVRAAIKAPVVSVGDGGAAKAKATQLKGEAQFARDFALRKYREVNERVANLRASLDSNAQNKRREIDAILEERRKCDFHKIGTLRCEAVIAMQQSDIDNKWHEIWMRDHRNWAAALDERNAVRREVIALGATVPAE